MPTSAINSLTGAITPSTATTAQTKLNEDYNQFLVLLTTQLKNQDPLEPMDTAEFTNQLVQFANVEQSIATNSHLENLTALYSNSAKLGALGYVGQEVMVVKDQGVLTDDGLKFRVATADAEHVETMTIQIVNSTGQIVKTATLQRPEGSPMDFKWDGVGLNTQNGQTEKLANGIYAIRVNAVDTNNQTIDSFVASSGIVTGLQSSDGDTYKATIGALTIDLKDILSVTSPGASDAGRRNL